MYIYYLYYIIMSSVLEILSYEELITRKTNLIKQLEKVDYELLKRNFNDNDNIMTIKNIDENNNLENSLVNINSKKIKIKLNIVRIK